jgi:hypothetical protein
VCYLRRASIESEWIIICLDRWATVPFYRANDMIYNAWLMDDLHYTVY